MKEKWKTIKGYEGLYKVSNLGRVRSLSRIIKRSDGLEAFRKGRILSANTSTRRNKYPRVVLRKGNIPESVYIHRLVLEAFVGPCPEGMECRHFPDRDPNNNTLKNLSWGTRKQNAKDRKAHKTEVVPGLTGEAHPSAKLTLNQVRLIRKRIRQGELASKLAQEFGVSLANICMIRDGKTWKSP